MKIKKKKGKGFNLRIPIMIVCILGTIFFFAYATYGLSINELFLPGRFNGLILHGAAAWFLAGAYYCLGTFFGLTVAATIISPVDLRPFSKWHRRILWLCGTLIALSIILAFWLHTSQYVR